MTAKEFVTKITQLKPKNCELVKSKYSADFINTMLSQYDVFSRTSNLKAKSNEIYNLLEQYNLSKLRIHDINFLNDEDIYSFNNFFFFAAHEIFYIGFDIITYEIIAYDLGKDEIFLKCASGPQSFLDALYRIKRIETMLLLNKDLADKYEDLAIAKVKECSKLAGGEKYKAFYDYVFGI
jgi:hypothetical protein